MQEGDVVSLGRRSFVPGKRPRLVGMAWGDNRACHALQHAFSKR
jgi:hypothetical protein